MVHREGSMRMGVCITLLTDTTLAILATLVPILGRPAAVVVAVEMARITIMARETRMTMMMTTSATCGKLQMRERA